MSKRKLDTAQDIARVCSRYLEGYSIKELAKLEGLNSCGVIRRILKENKILLRGPKESVRMPRSVTKLTGPNHPNWKGGHSQGINQAIRKTERYRRWRKKIYERDCFTCVGCGLTYGKGKKVTLHCDHIIPLYKIIADNKITTIAEAHRCENIWNHQNGRILCKDCHIKTESYGMYPDKYVTFEYRDS